MRRFKDLWSQPTPPATPPDAALLAARGLTKYELAPWRKPHPPTEPPPRHVVEASQAKQRRLHGIVPKVEEASPEDASAEGGGLGSALDAMSRIDYKTELEASGLVDGSDTELSSSCDEPASVAGEDPYSER